MILRKKKVLKKLLKINYRKILNTVILSNTLNKKNKMELDYILLKQINLLAISFFKQHVKIKNFNLVKTFFKQIQSNQIS
jgi:hypothetical protein